MNITYYNAETAASVIKKLSARSALDGYGDIPARVAAIVEAVKDGGDRAVFDYTRKFDGWEINAGNAEVSEAEIDEAFAETPPRLIEILRTAAGRIRDFHEKQKQNTWLDVRENGEILGMMTRPLERAGVYVPGGKAAYPSSVLMNIIPAKIAGVPEVLMVTPAMGGKLPGATIVAAKIAGADKIYKIGGAQAIAALAFGTETIPRADKIVGPGNIYVALAKRLVYGYAGIDSIAGPSEILVIADSSANPRFVAADLLSQAEHDELASAILITDRKTLADEVSVEIEAQTAALPRREIIRKSLEDFGEIIITKNMDEAAALSNLVAPEHLELCVSAPFDLLTKIKNAGAVFLGHFSPEPLGDYMAGANHVLPTGGTARFFSPLSVDDFIKKTSVISFGKDALLSLAEDIIDFAEAEGLAAHANAVRWRLESGV